MEGFCGFCVGIIFTLVTLTFATGGEGGAVAHLAERRAAIEQCEKDLPRSQKCILTAIPEVKDVP